jgi:hypothetical protein
MPGTCSSAGAPLISSSTYSSSFSKHPSQSTSGSAGPSSRLKNGVVGWLVRDRSQLDRVERASIRAPADAPAAALVEAVELIRPPRLTPAVILGRRARRVLSTGAGPRPLVRDGFGLLGVQASRAAVPGTSHGSGFYL